MHTGKLEALFNFLNEYYADLIGTQDPIIDQSPGWRFIFKFRSLFDPREVRSGAIVGGDANPSIKAAVFA